MVQVRSPGAGIGHRLTLLATTALVALTPALATPPEEVSTGVSLTAGADVLATAVPAFNVDRSPDLFGMAPPQRVLGLDARGGNDVVTLTGNGVVDGRLSQTRIYANLPVDLPTLTLFTEAPVTRIGVTGADGGTGTDSLLLASGGRLTVNADGSFNLGKLDMDVSVPTTLNPQSLNADLDVAAAGMSDLSGSSTLAVAGRLESSAAATGTRTELNVSIADLSNQPQLLTATAAATGLRSGGAADSLSLASGGRLSATADSLAVGTDLTFAGLVVGSPESAAVATALALAMDAGAGNDVVTNAGRSEVTTTAKLVETGIAVVAAGYTLPEILVPDTSPESSANARALGLVGGLGADSVTNSGELNLSAESEYIRTSFAFTDAGIDATAIEMLIEPPTFPEEPERGAVARVAGILGDDNPVVEQVAGGASSDSIVNSGSIKGVAEAKMTTAAVQIAVPINEVTGVSDTTAGKLIDAFSIGLTDDAAAAAAAFAAGILGGSGADRITHAGDISLDANARSDTGQFKLDVSSFLEPEGEPGAGESGETSFSLSLDVFNTGSFAVSESTGLDGGSANDQVSTLAGSKIVARTDARARTLDADITVSKSDDTSYNLGGSVVFSQSLAGATSIGVAGGAGDDRIASAGSIDVAADALVQALKANLKVDVAKSGVALNAQMVDAEMQATASSTGIQALNVGDEVTAGTIKARATSDVETLTVAVNVQVATEKGLTGTGSFLSADYRSQALAMGVDRDTLVGPVPPRGPISGSPLPRTVLLDGAVVDVGATADFSRIGVAANVAAAKTGAAIAASIFQLNADATAQAFGVRGSLFEDHVTSGAAILASASAEGFSTETAVTVAGGKSAVGAGVGLILADSAGRAVARGIDLGGGTNTVQATGAPITATAVAANTSNGNGASVNGAEKGVGAGAAVVKLSNAAIADAAAVSSGDGTDKLDLGGPLTSTASAEADIITVTLAVSGTMEGVGVGAGVILADGTADATARGVTTGAGNAFVTLRAPVLTAASAVLDSIGVGAAVAGSKSGVGAGASVLSTRFASSADAVGAALGAGVDTVSAAGALLTTASADSTVDSVAVTVTGALDGVGAGAGVVLADVSATASAAGADLGADADRGVFGAAVTSLATAAADNLGAAVSVSGANNGVGAGAAAVVGSTLSSAQALGVGAGAGDDEVTLGAATATATGTTTTLDIAANVSGANNGVGAGAGVILAGATSEAGATALDLGAGNDRATADGRLSGNATAITSTTGVGVNVTGVNNGVAAGASLIMAEVAADATGAGLDAGSGDDRVEGNGSLASTVTATAQNVSASVGVQGAVNGVAVGAGLVFADTSAGALGHGGLLGDGADRLVLAGGADSRATATALSTSVGVALSGTYQGVGAGVALVDGETESTATALGADGGAGDDVVDLGGRVITVAESTARNLGVSVGLGFSVFGVGAGGAALLGSVDSTAVALGVGGGDGADGLTVRDTVTVQALSTAQQTNITVSIGAAIGVAVSASYIDSALRAAASATGLAGGAGNDLMATVAPVSVSSTATGTGASYSFSFSAGVGLGLNLLTAGTESMASATGQSGDAGDDEIRAFGDVTATAAATSTGSSLSVTLTGANIGSLSNDAYATAIGLDGGADNDLVHAMGTVRATATATPNASTIGIGFTGATLGDIGNVGLATAIALSGGDGNDLLISDRRAEATATSQSDIDTVGVQLTGAQLTELASRTQANATGISGGLGNDTILARDTRATAAAGMTGDSYGVTVAGLTGQDSSLSATALAAAVDGGDGLNGASLLDTRATATASVDPSQLAVSLVGVNDAVLGNRATATATGYRGGTGRDEVALSGITSASSTASASNDRISVSLTGGDLSGTQLNATADSALARSGDGGDLVTTTGDLTLASTATAISDVTTVNLVGATDAALGARAVSRGLGLGGGGGADALGLGGSIVGTATAIARSSSDTIGIIGGAIGRSRNIADAAIAAIETGAGNDVAETSGNIQLTATSTVRTDTLAFSGVGGNAGIGGMDSLAMARGIDTGATDTALAINNASNLGQLGLFANARTQDNNTAMTLFGAAVTSADTLLRATVAGMTGYGGRDTLLNSGTMTLGASALGGAGRSSLTLLGGTSVTAATTLQALGTGLVGGEGIDVLRNDGALVGTAQATARSSSLSGTGAGITMGNTDNLADARMTGMDGGGGADSLVMAGAMVLSSTATSLGADWSATLLGGAATRARTLAAAQTLGMMGGSGNDAILHSGSSTLSALSRITSVSRSIVLGGASSGEAGLTASTEVIGIDGGSDADSIEVQAGSQLTLTADAGLFSLASSMNLVAFASTSGIGGASSFLLGIAGGSGNDSIAMAGRMTATALAGLEVVASGFSVLGATAQSGSFRATTTAIGIDAGADNDQVTVTGWADVKAQSNATYAGTAMSAVGTAGVDAAVGASARAVGIGAGNGTNAVLLDGGSDREFTVLARADTALESGSTVFLGSAVSNGATSSLSSASGMLGGTGNDSFTLGSTLEVTGRAGVMFQSATFAFIGASSGATAALARGNAFGIEAGNGTNSLFMGDKARLLIDVQVDARGSAAAGAAIGSANAAAVTRGETSAFGITSGNGADSFNLGGTLLVEGGATVGPNVVVNSGALFADGIARARGEGLIRGGLLTDAGGATTVAVRSGGLLELTLGEGSDNQVNGVVRADATSNGVSGGIEVDARANSEAVSLVDAVGIGMGTGSGNSVGNDGTIRVNGLGVVDARSLANGNAAVSGDATATSTSSLVGSTGRGVASAAPLTLVNGKTISVEMKPVALAIANSGANGLGTSDPDARSTATANASSVVATGVEMGGGALTNLGDIRVVSAPRAVAVAGATRSGSFNTSIDSFATTNAFVNAAQAYGVRANSNAVTILNEGTIRASATPTAISRAGAFGHGTDGDATAAATAQAVGTLAVGIDLEAAGSAIVNRGTIQATAVNTVTALPEAVRGGTGTASATPLPLSSSLTYGIRAAGGTNTITNQGTITGAWSILTGGGVDTVNLLGGSTLGIVDLGDGNDSLVIRNTPVINGQLIGGRGTDSMLIDGAATLGGGISAFEQLTKIGGGQANLGSIAFSPTGFTRIEGGTVRIQGGLASTSHMLTTLIYPNGTLGALVNGSAAVFVPRGALTVEAGAAGPFVNGTTWDVIQSASIMGVGSLTVALPAPTALRSFSSGLALGSTRYRVSVSVAPMAGMADNQLAASYGAALDAVTPIARGSVAATIAGIQDLPTVDAVRSALNAEAPTMPVRALSVTGAMLDSALAVASAAPSGLGVAPVPAGMALAGRAAAPGVMGQWHAQFSDLPAGNAGMGRGIGTGFASGLTALSGDRLEVGVGMMWMARDTQFTTGGGRSEATVLTGRLGFAPTPDLSITTSLAAGSGTFDGVRALGLDGLGVNRQAGGMLAFDSQFAWAPVRGVLNPILGGGVSWRRVDGGDMNEGGTGLALRVDSSYWQRAEMRLGVSFGPEWRLGDMRFTSRIAVNWLHQLGGPQDGVEARFADMPEYRFVLSSGLLPENSVALEAGLGMTSGRWSLNAGATSRADVEGRWTEGRVTLGRTF